MTPQRRRRGSALLRAPRTRGQALVEIALVAPFLVMLLLGGAQVGSIAYNQVSLDSAAREGARAGSAAPTQAVFSKANNSQWYTAGNSATYTYNCQAADFADPGANPVCLAVLKSAGYLGATTATFTNNPCGSNQPCVTITVVPPANLVDQRTGPPALRLVSVPQAAPDAGSSPCNSGNQAEVDGTVNFGSVSGFSSGTLSDSTNDPQVTVTQSSPTYQFCVSASGQVASQTIAAQVGPPSCGGYTGTVTVPSVTHGKVYSNENITLSAEPSCTTATTSTTSSSSTTTTSSSSTTTTSTTTSSSVTGPATGCSTHPVDDSYYFKVTVTYPAPIFIPFLNNLFQTSSGIRMITASVTYPIDPCTMTDS